MLVVNVIAIVVVIVSGQPQRAQRERGGWTTLLQMQMNKIVNYIINHCPGEHREREREGWT